MIENGAPGDLGRRARRLLGLAMISALLVAVVYLVFVRTAEGQRLDDAALGGRGRRPPEVVHGALDLLVTVDAGSLVVAALAVAAVGYRQGRLDLAAAAGGVILGATATTELLKRVVLGRPALLDRPDPFGAQNSLPSGHAAVALAVAAALVLAVPPAARTVVALIGGAYALAVGAATITAGWHRPSDVVAAVLVVLAWGAVAVLGLRLVRWRRAARPGRPSWLGVVPLLATAAITAPVTVLGLLLGKTSESMTTTPEPSRLTFLTGAAGTAAVVAIGFLVWLWLTTDDENIATP